MRKISGWPSNRWRNKATVNIEGRYASLGNAMIHPAMDDLIVDRYGRRTKLTDKLSDAGILTIRDLCGCTYDYLGAKLRVGKTGITKLEGLAHMVLGEEEIVFPKENPHNMNDPLFLIRHPHNTQKRPTHDAERVREAAATLVATITSLPISLTNLTPS